MQGVLMKNFPSPFTCPNPLNMTSLNFWRGNSSQILSTILTIHYYNIQYSDCFGFRPSSNHVPLTFSIPKGKACLPTIIFAGAMLLGFASLVFGKNAQQIPQMVILPRKVKKIIN